MGQSPLTFHRQVLATVLCPSLLRENIFPEDVKTRAKKLLGGTANGSIGAYTTSQGMKNIRQTVASFIEKRDGIKSDPNEIFLFAGASQAIKCVFSCLISGPQDGILVPIPQYPLYTATITYKNGTKLTYELDESKNWAFDVKKAQESIDNAKKNGVKCRGIVVINPGNPTGQCYTEKTINEIINFAYKNKIAIFADEVYQENIYDKENILF